MHKIKILSIILLSIILWSCGSNSGQKKNAFSIHSNARNNSISNSEVLALSLKNPDNLQIDSVHFNLDGENYSR